MNLQNKIIIIPFSLPWDWSADYQRQTCLNLANRGIQVIAYMYDDAHFFLGSDKKKYPIIKNIYFYIPKYFIPFRRIALIEKINSIISIFLVNLKFMYLQKIIWIFDPFFMDFSNWFTKKIQIYDCVDNHGTLYQKLEEKLIRKSDYFFVNSNALFTFHKKTKVANKVVKQGFDLNTFQNYSKKLEKTKNQNEFTVGFIGGINNRLDFKILIPLVKNNPKWNFELWGPIQNNDAIFNRKLLALRQLPNIVFKETKDKLKLIKSVRKFDVCIIPYDISQSINFYSYPMKLFEYFYLGKPVVSTPILELTEKKFKGIVYTGQNHKEFENTINKILTQGWSKQKSTKQKKLAIQNSWENKISEILKILE